MQRLFCVDIFLVLVCISAIFSNPKFVLAKNKCAITTSSSHPRCLPRTQSIKGFGSYYEYLSYTKWLKDFKANQDSVCGKPVNPLEFAGDMTGFRRAPEGAWPWMVSMYRLPGALTEFFDLFPAQFQSYAQELLRNDFPFAVPDHSCGGTLISPEFVLTAAHCVQFANYDIPADVTHEVRAIAYTSKLWKKCREANEMNRCDVEVTKYLTKYQHDDTVFMGRAFNATETWELWLGSYIRPPFFNKKTKSHIRRVKVKKIIPHPMAKHLRVNGHHGDLALLQLAEPINKWSDYIRPICLTDYTPKVNGKKAVTCAVSGWGVRYDAKGEPKLTNYLQDSEYQLMKTQHCKHKVSQYPVFDSADVSRPDKNLILCALELNSKAIKTPGEKTKICYGDSGGPLICKYNDGRWYQLGISSYGESLSPSTCEIPASPDVFTNTISFVDWILKTMWENSK